MSQIFDYGGETTGGWDKGELKEHAVAQCGRRKYQR